MQMQDMLHTVARRGSASPMVHLTRVSAKTRESSCTTTNTRTHQDIRDIVCIAPSAIVCGATHLKSGSWSRTSRIERRCRVRRHVTPRVTEATTRVPISAVWNAGSDEYACTYSAQLPPQNCARKSHHCQCGAMPGTFDRLGIPARRQQARCARQSVRRFPPPLAAANQSRHAQCVQVGQ